MDRRGPPDGPGCVWISADRPSPRTVSPSSEVGPATSWSGCLATAAPATARWPGSSTPLSGGGHSGAGELDGRGRPGGPGRSRRPPLRPPRWNLAGAHHPGQLAHEHGGPWEGRRNNGGWWQPLPWLKEMLGTPRFPPGGLHQLWGSGGPLSGRVLGQPRHRRPHRADEPERIQEAEGTSTPRSW